MTNARLISAPAVEPVSLADFLAHIRIEPGVEDDDCQQKLTAATRIIEQATGRLRLLKSTWEWTLEEWPCDEDIDLPIPQVQSVSSITYMDSGGTTHTLSASDYRLVNGYDPTTCAEQVTGLACVTLKSGKYWPTSILERGEPITVTFVAGWNYVDGSGNPIDVVPSALKTAILLQAGHLYRNREAITLGVTQTQSLDLVRGVEYHIAPYRVYEF